MERFMLDASIIIDLLAQSPNSKAARKLLETGEACTSVICYCEVLNKISLEHAATAEHYLSKLLVFQVTIEDGKTAKEIQYACRKKGKQVPTLDCLIAASAINTNAAVVTSDNDFERIEGVQKYLF